MTAARIESGQMPDAGSLEKLGLDECWDLVGSRAIGRFAVGRTGSGPLVVPVNYAVGADRTIVFRSGAGTKLDAAQLALVSLQVDEVDPFHHTGWSVLIEGTAHWLYAEQDDIELETWAPGDRPYVIRITPTRVTGRRIELTQADTDHRGYR
jgi:hypothetical protein